MKSLAVKLMVCAVVAFTASAKQDWELQGADWETKSAAEKQNTIWQNVIADRNSQAWKGALGIAGFLAESMQPTVSWLADTLPYSWLGGKRSKYIHTVGAVGKVKFVPTANSEGYTGMLESGADYGLIRFSCGAQPDTSKPKAAQANRNFAPGFGLKFLIDGEPSANLVTLTAQQDNWNFFANDFSNHIPIPPEPIFSKFKSATDYPQHVGLSDFSKHHHDGKEVSSPKFPFALTFQATDALRTGFPEDFSGVDFTNQLETVPAGSKLFSVLAQAEPTSAKVHIGDLILTSEITKSMYGD